jgi:hypothetical protein
MEGLGDGGTGGVFPKIHFTFTLYPLPFTLYPLPFTLYPLHLFA